MRRDRIYGPIDPTRRLRVREAICKIDTPIREIMKQAGMSSKTWYEALRNGRVCERTFVRIERAVFSKLRNFVMETRAPGQYDHAPDQLRRADKEFIWRLEDGREVFVLEDLKPVPDGSIVWVTGYATHFALPEGDMLYVQAIKRTRIKKIPTMTRTWQDPQWPDVRFTHLPIYRSRNDWPAPAEPTPEFLDWLEGLFAAHAPQTPALPSEPRPKPIALNSEGRVNYRIQSHYDLPWVPAVLREDLHEWDNMTAAERDVHEAAVGKLEDYIPE